MKRPLVMIMMAFGLILCEHIAAAESLVGSRPNIVLVMTDFQVSPTCAPTCAALMSGRPPFKVGVTHNMRTYRSGIRQNSLRSKRPPAKITKSRRSSILTVANPSNASFSPSQRN